MKTIRFKRGHTLINGGGFKLRSNTKIYTLSHSVILEPKWGFNAY